MSDRYIPSLNQIELCAKELPLAQTWREGSCQVPLSPSRAITFRRVKFKTSAGTEYRWIYEGKILIDPPT